MPTFDDRKKKAAQKSEFNSTLPGIKLPNDGPLLRERLVTDFG